MMEMRTECFVIFLVITGTSGFVNLVHSQGYTGKEAMSGIPQLPVWNADKAIDGNSNQDYRSNSCAISNIDRDKLKRSYLKMWLEQQFSIAYLEIYFRSDTYQRSTGFSLYTFDTQEFFPFINPKHLVYHHNPMSGCPSPIMNVTVNNVTQGLVFINERPAGYTSNCQGDNTVYTGIELCEIKVMGCDQNMYTTECNRPCPSKCKNNHCDVFDGSCIHGCSDPNAVTIDCIVCDDGMYVKNKMCLQCPGHCKTGAPCNKLTGRCDNGCDGHWTGEFCQICPPNYYGIGCSTACGQCRGDDVCNNMTGHCPNGCKPHSTGLRCDECDDGYYSYMCTVRCGHCAHNDICDKDSGYCPRGCDKNYKFPFCQECDNGFYGSRCNSTCGDCLNGESCDKSNGHCPRGCQLHFQPPLCQECENGFYDSNCNSTCGLCLNDENCDKSNGHCSHGCQLHFQPPLCQVCENGYYGGSCENKCGYCLNGEQCDKQNGTCTRGCQPHFLYPSCKVCKDGFYGVNCSQKCGQCDDDYVCDKRTGYCLMGCKNNLQPPFCKADTSELERRREQSMAEKNNVPDTGFYAAIGILTTLLVLSVGVNIYQRRQVSGLLRDRRQTENTQTRNPVQPQDYVDITQSDEKHEYTSLDTVKQESHYNVI